MKAKLTSITAIGLALVAVLALPSLADKPQPSTPPSPTPVPGAGCAVPDGAFIPSQRGGGAYHKLSGYLEINGLRLGTNADVATRVTVPSCAGVRYQLHVLEADPTLGAEPRVVGSAEQLGDNTDTTLSFSTMVAPNDGATSGVASVCFYITTVDQSGRVIDWFPHFWAANSDGTASLTTPQVSSDGKRPYCGTITDDPSQVTPPGWDYN